jgi:hypothetical protein
MINKFQNLCTYVFDGVMITTYLALVYIVEKFNLIEEFERDEHDPY